MQLEYQFCLLFREYANEQSGIMSLKLHFKLNKYKKSFYIRSSIHIRFRPAEQNGVDVDSGNRFCPAPRIHHQEQQLKTGRQLLTTGCQLAAAAQR